MKAMLRRNKNLLKLNKNLTIDDVGKLIALGAIIVGGWLRLLPPLMAGFPINDGGLFYVMLQSLLHNGFKLPEYISYNGLSIPFAYPPVAFYVGGLISSIFQISLLDLLRWMPGIVSILTLIVFYDLAKTLLSTDFEAGLATLFLAFTPRAVTWFLMGGGLTRGLGEVFLILTIRYVYSLFTVGGRKRFVLAILFSSLVVLTHPEATIHAIVICVLIWVFFGRTKTGCLRAFSVATGVLAVTSFWWIVILTRYGWEPIFSAMQTGRHSPLPLFRTIMFAVSEEPFFTTIALLGLMGLLIKITQRAYFLPAFYLLPFIAEPRNAPNVAIIPLALLAVVSLTEMILPTLASFGKTLKTDSHLLSARSNQIFIAILMFSLFINFGYNSLQLSKNHLFPETLDTFDWVKNNTQPDSKFLILTGEPEPFCDSVQEWFPVFTQRISLTTPQGKEWDKNTQFGQFREDLFELQSCANRDIACVEGIVQQMEDDYDYLFIQRTAFGKIFCIPRVVSYRGGNLILSIEENKNNKFIEIYNREDATIYAIQNE